MKMLATSITLLTIFSSAYAANTQITSAQKAIADKAVVKISDKVGKKLPITNITTTPVPDLLQVTSEMSVFYVSTDGKYAVFGDLVALDKDQKEWSITEQTLRTLRVQALAQVSTNDMIIFPSGIKNKLGTITVFTDLDCPYCRKMQEHISEYTDLGIEVRYLAFPRAGIKSKSFAEAEKVWCAKDKAKAFEIAATKQEFPKDTCSNNPVKAQFELGQKMGITGTPTIILSNGAKIPGMIEPKALAKIIAQQ